MAVLVQIDAWDPTAGAAVTLRVASHDDPAVCHLNDQVWWPALSKLPALAYDLFDGAFGGQIESPTTSFEIVAEQFPNLARYALASARVQIWTGSAGAAWSDYTLRATGRVSTQPKIEDLVVSFDLEADGAWLDTPLLSTYAGSGGAEGASSLTGSVKPLCLGTPRYVAGVLVDTVNSVFQVSGYGSIAFIDSAMDELVRFGSPAGDYATYDALVAATIGAGAWATCLAGGYVRFGAPPAGKVSFLVQGDNAGPDGLARKPGQLIRRIAGISGGAAYLDDASLNALDAACPWNLSVYVGDQTTARDLIQSIAQSVNATAGVSWLGKLFVAPVKIGPSVLTLAADGSALPPISTVTQENIDAPFWRLAVQAERTWEVHDLSDIATAATFNPRGDYDPTATYRYGDVVKDDDGSRWEFINANPATGHAPPDPTYWDAFDSSSQEALDRIAAIESDSILSAGEKPAVIQSWQTIEAEAGPLQSQAATLAVDYLPLANARNALGEYLSSLSPSWSDTTQDTAINPNDFQGKFGDYYYARTLLINAIAQAAAQSASGYNRVKFSNFEKGTTGWVPYVPGPLTLNDFSRQSYNGIPCVGANVTATAANQQVNLSDYGYEFPVTPGERLAVQSGIAIGNIQKVTLQIQYFDGNGNGVGADQVDGPVSSNYNTKTRFFSTVPAKASIGRLVAYLYSAAAGTVLFNFAQPMVCSVPVGQTTWPPFVPGQNATDGADVTGQNIAIAINGQGSLATKNQANTGDLAVGAVSATHAVTWGDNFQVGEGDNVYTDNATVAVAGDGQSGILAFCQFNPVRGTGRATGLTVILLRDNIQVGYTRVGASTAAYGIQQVFFVIDNPGGGNHNYQLRFSVDDTGTGTGAPWTINGNQGAFLEFRR